MKKIKAFYYRVIFFIKHHKSYDLKWKDSIKFLSMEYEDE